MIFLVTDQSKAPVHALHKQEQPRFHRKFLLNKKRIIRERYSGWCAFDCLYFYTEKSYLLCSCSNPCSA